MLLRDPLFSGVFKCGRSARWIPDRYDVELKQDFWPSNKYFPNSGDVFNNVAVGYVILSEEKADLRTRILILLLSRLELLVLVNSELCFGSLFQAS